ncbi:MSMEG_1061 family FMN-dependent PPOX-type flavoprotein [Thalassococcus sp. S3]|uniref:MSMEG_1061 family FMN-dependent PPOX-type flavoprotein n=1 Tax=Thalassococcus sp. S3 TaxID=2017482 RepID=UPI0013EEAB49|nr:MSMEG_1061 family FMN-dependent PPOX-type flavoprotein [Thalassococcus sp. S3]
MDDMRTISSKADLLKGVPDPYPFILEAVKPEMDEFHIAFVERAPFLCLSSVDASGFPNISPRGDSPGFVKVMSSSAIAVPDRVGNNKMETSRAVLENPHVGIIFLLPGVRETVRMKGTAHLTDDAEVLSLWPDDKWAPKRATMIDVSMVTFHCGKSVVRSGLWKADQQLEPGGFPSLGAILRGQATLPAPVEAVDEMIEGEYRDAIE